MKHYISVGIGDMMSLDALLTPEEKLSITEIYWACRWGIQLVPLFRNNEFYPNLTKQYTIKDNVGKKHMSGLEPHALEYWHFRPDFNPNFSVGLKLFGLTRDEVCVIDAVSIFQDSSRVYQHSSFLANAKLEDVQWDDLEIQPEEYILFHYPTATRRPRNDIATIEEDDWLFVEELSTKENKRVVVITDIGVDPPLSNVVVLKKPHIKTIVSLCKYSSFYAGCDSFVSLLACKKLTSKNLFVKGHDYMQTHGRSIKDEILSSAWLQNHFSPHTPENIVKFYRNRLSHA